MAMSLREVIMGLMGFFMIIIIAGSHGGGETKQTGLLHPQRCVRDCSFSPFHLKGAIFSFIYFNFFHTP